MTGSVMLFDPTVPPGAGRLQGARSLTQLKGTVVGFVDNAKPNFSNLVEALSTLLVERYGVQRIITRRKHAASVPAQDSVLNELAEQCDVVIAGSGD